MFNSRPTTFDNIDKIYELFNALVNEGKKPTLALSATPPSNRAATPNSNNLLNEILKLQLRDSHVEMLQAISPAQSHNGPLHHLVNRNVCIQTYSYQSEALQKLSDLYQEWLSNKNGPTSPLQIANIDINQIVKMEFILLTAGGIEEDTSLTYSIVIDITQRSKEKSLFTLSYTHANSIHNLSLLLNVAPENAFKLPNEVFLSNREWDSLSLYTEETTSIYETLHEEMADAALNLLISQISSEKPVIIIDVATGTGNALHSVQRKLDPHFITRSIGIDLNTKNIALAKKNFPQYDFFQVNAENVYRFAQEKIALAQADGTNPFVLVIASGFLTRKVTANTIIAANIIQQFSRFADAAIITGITDVLFTKRIAKKIGWLPQVLHSKAGSSLYVLSKNLSHYQLSSTHLDLSLHGHPVDLVQHKVLNEHREKVTTLDLGLAYICPGDEVVNLLSCLPKLTTICVSGKENWYSFLIDYLEKTKSDVIVVTNPNYYITGQELNTLSNKKQQRLCMQLGLYRPTLTSLKERAKARPDVYSLPTAEDEHPQFISKLETLVDKFDDDTALYVLADILSNRKIKDNKDIETDFIKAIKYLRKLMEKGYPDLINQLRDMIDKVAQVRSNQYLRPY